MIDECLKPKKILFTVMYDKEKQKSLKINYLSII